MKNLFKYLSLFIITFVMSSATAGADAFGDYLKGFTAHLSGDLKEAVRWYRLAGDQGNIDAQSSLGSMYSFGTGVPQDYAEAVKWYRLAAEQGDADAQFNFGTMYREGLGIPQDYAEAVKWYRLAAEQGDAYAQLNLGAMYMDGMGLPQDFVIAYKWLNLSAAQGEKNAKIGKERVEKKMTRQQIAEGQRLSGELFTIISKENL
jgi:uncharacterized protein